MVWVAIVVALVMAVVGEILRPKQKFSNPEPSALGDFSFPTADPSRVVPIFWGTCKMEGPNCTWFGDLEVVTLKKKVKTGWFSSTRVTVGFNYYLGVQLVYAYGECDEFLELRADDKVLNVSTKTFTGDVCAFTIDSPSILSTDDPPSGVKGSAKLYKGTFAQPVNAYLGVQWAEPDMSAFRPLLHLVLEKCYLGNTETPPPITLIARRCPNQLGLTSNMHNVNGDANIACAAYELMTDMLWGMKIPTGKIDIDSFRACGVTTFGEGLGISMLIQNPTSGRDLLAEVLRHADAVIYADPVTGLYTMALARDDYLDNIEELLVLDNSNMVPDTFEFSRMSWEMTKNTIVVNYTERETFQTTPVQYQDLANIDVRQGTIDSEEINFLGFSNANAALNAAARACKIKSSPLMSASFSTDRIGYQLRPGSVFILSRPQDGLVQVIMRVIEISYGTLDDMTIKIKAMEDVFAIGHIAYSTPTPSDWVSPVGPPVALTRQAAFEVPYQFIGNDGVFVGTLASKQSGSDTAYDIWSGDASGDVNLSFKSSTQDYTASGLLTAEYPSSTPARDPTGFDVNNTKHMDEVVSVSENELLQGDSIALIISGAGREFVAFKNKTDEGSGVYGISDVIRGVYGTSPLTHAAGSVVWFLSSGFAIENETSRAIGTAYLKYLPKNLSGTLPLASATQLSLALTGIAAKPNPPSYLRANGLVSPAGLLAYGDVALTWEWRDIQVQGGRITSGGSGYDPVPNGGFFTGQIYVGGVLKRTLDNLNVFSHSYTTADQVTDGAQGTACDFRIKYTSPTGLVTSTTIVTFTPSLAITTTSLLHFDGADGSTTFTDQNGRIWTRFGSAEIDTAQSRFGGASGLFNGTNAYLTTPFEAGIDVLGSDFTIEFWLRRTASGSSKRIFSTGGGTVAWNATTGIHLLIQVSTSDQLGVQLSTGTATPLAGAGGVLSVAGSFQHIAVCKSAGTVRAYIDGVKVIDMSSATVVRPSTGPSAAIGTIPGEGAGGTLLNAHLDEFRISKGVALYTSNFTPPSSPFTYP